MEVKKMKSNISEVKNAAVKAFESVMPAKDPDPRKDSRWLIVQNLHNLNIETLERAERALHEAHLMKLAALNAYCSSKVTQELLAEHLGIELESEEESDNE